MMTSTQVVETSVSVTSNSPSQDYTHMDDKNIVLCTCDMTPGFKPFTVPLCLQEIIPRAETCHDNLKSASRYMYIVTCLLLGV